MGILRFLNHRSEMHPWYKGTEVNGVVSGINLALLLQLKPYHSWYAPAANNTKQNILSLILLQWYKI